MLLRTLTQTLARSIPSSRRTNRCTNTCTNTCTNRRTSRRTNRLGAAMISTLRLDRSTAASEQGITLLESLVAIAIIGLTVTMIAPPLLIATATRVQNRRAEQALQIAQAEVDRIRTLVAQDEHNVSRLPRDIGAKPTGGLDAHPAPQGISSAVFRSPNKRCNNSNVDQDMAQTNPARVPVNQAFPVDIDGDCNSDFLVQIFRTAGTFTRTQSSPASSDGRPSSFELGVRVYAQLASEAILERRAGTKTASLQLTSGQGRQGTNPLAVLYLPIHWSDQDATLCGYQQANRDKLTTACAGVFPSPSPSP